MRPRLAIPKLVAPLAVAALALGACGGYGDDSSEDGSGQAASASGEAAAAALVGTGPSPLGDVLTTADGKTLYGLTDDQGGTPTCAGDCAATWPPVLVESAELPEGLDPEVYSVVQRDDGSYQLAAGDWPLYSFAADSEPGDVEGQGSGGVWFAVAPGGQLLRDAAVGPEQDGGSGDGYDDGSGYGSGDGGADQSSGYGY